MKTLVVLFIALALIGCGTQSSPTYITNTNVTDTVYVNQTESLSLCELVKRDTAKITVLMDTTGSLSVTTHMRYVYDENTGCITIQYEDINDGTTETHCMTTYGYDEEHRMVITVKSRFIEETNMWEKYCTLYIYY